ncbi:hypothetical protein STEG23_017205, partial [Scotinomys teguina]
KEREPEKKEWGLGVRTNLEILSLLTPCGLFMFSVNHCQLLPPLKIICCILVTKSKAFPW